MIKLFLFSLVGLLFVSCNNKYSVEDELYKQIDDRFTKHSINLTLTLDSLEILYLNEGLLKSKKAKDYRDYYQTNMNVGELRQLQNDYLKKILSRVQLDQDELETSLKATFDGATFTSSKYGKISLRIDSLVQATGQITSSSVASSHLHYLSEKDFEHPYYRANILLSLQWLYFWKYIGK